MSPRISAISAVESSWSPAAWADPSGWRLGPRAVGHQVLDHRRVGQRGDVAEVADVVLGHLPQDPAHDLARAGLRQNAGLRGFQPDCRDAARYLPDARRPRGGGECAGLDARPEGGGPQRRGGAPATGSLDFVKGI